jgi:ketosteroid isomerase-like protein
MPESIWETDQQKVIAVTDEEAAAIETGDAQRYLALLADDALFMPPNSLAKQGEELREWLCDFVERYRVHYLRLTHDETVVEGSLAYHRFTYGWNVTPREGGETLTGHGKGLHILRRQPDGAWKIAREIWNAIPAPENTL